MSEKELDMILNEIGIYQLKLMRLSLSSDEKELEETRQEYREFIRLLATNHQAIVDALEGV